MKNFISLFSALLMLLGGASAYAASHFELNLQSTHRAFVRGEIFEALAFFETKARQEEERARTNPSDPEPLKTAAKAYFQASVAARLAGQLQKAINYGERGLDLATRVRDIGLQLGIINHLHLAYSSARDFRKTKEVTEKGFRMLKDSSIDALGRLLHEGLHYDRLARNEAQDGDYDSAITNYFKSIQLQEAHISELISGGTANESLLELRRTGLLTTVTRLADTYRAVGKQREALYHYQKVSDSIKGWNMQYAHEGLLYLGIGETYLQQRDLPRAEANFQKALAIAKDRRWPGGIRMSSIGLGEIYRGQGRLADAVAYYEDAIRRLESVRSRLRSEELRQSFFEGWLTSYSGIADALVKLGQHEEAFNYSERGRSRAFLDLLGSKVRLTRARSATAQEEQRATELRSMLGGAEEEVASGIVAKKREEAEREYPALIEKIKSLDKEQASLMSVDPLTLKEIREHLEPSQTLLEYFLTPEKTFLWVVTKDRLKTLTIPISAKDLGAKVNALRKAIAELRPMPEYQKISRELYSLLLQPALSDIKGKEVAIVPHGVLHYLPFQALRSSRGKYLIEERSLSYLSSASLLQFTTAKRKPTREKILAVGNPRLNNTMVELQAAESETREVARLYPGSKTLLKESATEEKIKELSAGYDVLHFAAHAELRDDDPLSSAILLANEGKEDGRLEVREIFQLNLNVDLVVLSGCETGLGKLSDGDEFVGLTRAFIYAGTPSVMASLWKVEDRSTAALMGSFYKKLKGMSKGEALRQAQLELIRGKGIAGELLAKRGVGGVGGLGKGTGSRGSLSTSHPYFWAPFILVGDGK